MSYFDDASLVMIPSGYKTSKVYSVKPTDGSGDLTFSRSNDTATRVNSAGLIEKVRTNLFPYSQTFANAAWLTIDVTKVSTSATDPNGGTTAANITWTSGSGRYFYQTQGTSSTGTISIWVKSNGGGNSFRLFANGAASFSSNLTATSTWTRYSFTFAGTGAANIGITNASDNSAADLLIAFAQFETGDIATDYIPTTTAAVSVGPVANVPRLDYLNSSCPRLLLEPQRTNLQVYSENFKNIAEGGPSNTWTPNDTIILSTNNTAPDGTLSATRIRGTSGGNKARQAVIFGTAGAPYSGSIYIRRVSGTASITLRVGDVAQGISINPTSAWQRFTSTASPTTTAVRLAVVFTNDTDEFEIWGAQLEAAAYATSYIPTLGAAVTRGADAASKTSASALIGQTEGTIVLNVENNESEVNSFITLSPSATTVSSHVYLGQSAGNLALYVRSGGTYSIIEGSITSISGIKKVALAYGPSFARIYVNGAQVYNSTAAVIPSGMDKIEINSFNTSSDIGRVSIGEALIFKTILPNSDLAALTA